jgi:hypothetical protein
MKIVQKIAIRFLIISAVLFCYGLSTYSSDFSNPYCIEFSEGNSSNKNSVILDIDPFSDDQIPQTDNYSLFSDPIMHIQTLQDVFLISNSDNGIWQPPKI